MNIYGLMVTRNEAGRWLRDVVGHALEWLDDLAVYDDDSTDDTREIARDAGAHVRIKEPWVPAFLEHEGSFRQAAWNYMERRFAPERGDWIAVIDADELVVDPARLDTRHAIELTVRTHVDVDGLTLAVREVFGFDPGGQPLMRIDKEWGRITGCRLYRWRPGARFAPNDMASGAVPVTGSSRPRVDRPTIVHLGYAHPDDRAAKYARYSGRGGHSSAHIESILQKGKLVPLDTPWPLSAVTA